MLAQLNPFDFVVLLTLSNTVQNAIIGNDTSLSGRHHRRGLAARRQRDPGPDLLPRPVHGAIALPRDRDICLIDGGRIEDDEMRRLHINAGELTAKAHERGFD